MSRARCFFGKSDPGAIAPLSVRRDDAAYTSCEDANEGSPDNLTVLWCSVFPEAHYARSLQRACRMTDSPAYLLENSGNRLIIALLPKLNQVAWADIDSIGTEVLGQLNQSANPRVLVDLCQLEYMGSAQVALIVRVFKAVKERSGTMVVANRHPVVQEVLTLAGLNKLWKIVTSREDGLKTLGGDPGRTTPSGTSGAGSANTGTLIVVGLIAANVSAAGLYAAVTQAPWLAFPASAWMAVASAAIALALSAAATLYASGVKKLIGTFVLLSSVGLLLGSVFVLNTPPASTSATSSDAEVPSKSEDHPAKESPVEAATTDSPAANPEPAGDDAKRDSATSEAPVPEAAGEPEKP